MVDISDMLFIVGHVGHIWRSWETKLYETITRSKVFEVQSFREQIFLGRYWDFFQTKIFETDTETFFETKVFETDTETFFRDQIFSRPIPRLFFETKYFRDRYRDFFSRPKFSRPRPILSKNWEKSRYREVSRRDVTLWSEHDKKAKADMVAKKLFNEATT